MLEVSRVGVTESDEDEMELSLELSIGGRYKKLEKTLGEEENSGKEISGKKKGVIIVPRSGLSFPTTAIVGDKVETGSEVVEGDYYSQRNKREIQALRRQEARKKREEKLRKSASNSVNAEDKMLLETQQLQSRAGDREMRENDGLVEDKEHIFAKCVGNEKNGSSGGSSSSKDSNFIIASRNNGGVSDRCQDHQGSGTKSPVSFLQNKVAYYPQDLECAGEKNGFAQPLRNHHMVGKDDENGGTKGKNVISQPVNFRPYPNGNGNLKRGGDSEQNSGKCGSEIPKLISSNASPEATSSAVSDYRSTSGKGGRHSSSSIGGAIQIIAASEKRDVVVKSSSQRPKPFLPPRMPCVSTTGNGPNGKTVMGFLYTYTKAEVSIVCVCHGTSFSPAQFVEHAGGAATHPLRHITMVPFPFPD